MFLCYNIYIVRSEGVYFILFYILAILIAVIGTAYSVFLDIVRVRSAENPTPENVADVYDEESYKSWREYSREHARLGIIFGICTLAITVLMLVLRVHAAFAELFPNTVFWQFFSVISLEILVFWLASIPKEYISDMVIEEKYGFNRMTKKTFAADQIRSLIISFAVSFILSGIIMLCHIWLGDYMVLLASASLVGFFSLISFLFPYLSRIGNKFTPLPDGELKERLMSLLISHGYEVRAIEIMDASRRTTKQNAYFTGFGKFKTIVLYDNLVNAMTPDEICAVFAHELGHGIHKHVLKLGVVNALQFVVISLAAWLIISTEGIFTDFGFAGVNYGFAFIILGLALNIIQPFTAIITNALSRRFEYAADRQAVKEGYGEAMIPALKKLAKDNFANLSPSFLNVILEYSHPPIDKRIEAIEKELSKL